MVADALLPDPFQSSSVLWLMVGEFVQKFVYLNHALLRVSLFGIGVE